MSEQKPKFKLEQHLNQFVIDDFKRLKLVLQVDYDIESSMPAYLTESLKGCSKTKGKNGVGKPDFSFTKFEIDREKVPVIIESKLGLKNLISETNDGKKKDEKLLNKYAVNDALYYAKGMIASGKYRNVIAIGVAGDSEYAIDVKVYYVYGHGDKSYKLINEATSLDFLQSLEAFTEFYKNAILTEEEKHDVLIRSQTELKKYAKSLNKLMHNLNITAPQRVLYVSGMLLAMQDVVDTDGLKLQDGMTPNDLKGLRTDSKRDGIQIINHINEFLKAKQIPDAKKDLMLASFSEISKDDQRDVKITLDMEVFKLIDGDASSNKQIFTFIYHNIFLSIDAMAGHLDIMGEMYSEFLKYALGDGKEIGIVLTPPYITKMMVAILGIDRNSKVMDLATGSAGFLISSMEMMIQDSEKFNGKKTVASLLEIKNIKKNQLLGIELNAEMFTLAATNMILRGDGSSNIIKGSAFDRPEPEKTFVDFKATKLLLNPPFSHSENGMPFIKYGLSKMAAGGLGAIIIQDSAGSGKAVSTNLAILKEHTLIASIKMPVDLFQPMAGVQTSIYIFKAKERHDFSKTVRFIDFRNDGYKRTSRAIQELDQPAKRYSDIIKIYKAGIKANVEAQWFLKDVCVDDFITKSGKDWNFDQHKVNDSRPTFDDFRKTVADYMSWEVTTILKMEDTLCEA